jgi:hypothetical protein
MARLHLLAGVLLAFIALATGCRETLNVGTVAVPTWDNAGSAFTVSVTVPGNARGGAAGNFVVNITGGTAPFEVTYAFNAGVTPRTTTRNINGRTDTLSVTFDDVSSDTPVSLTVTVKDANNRTGTRTRTFTLRPGGAANTNPTLAAIADDATCSVAVTVTDADGDDVVVTPTAPAGFNAVGAQTAAGGTGILTFTFTPTDPVAGASGDITFAADDGAGGTGAATATLTCAAQTLAADTLYAIPSSNTVTAGTPVTITVYTGDPTNPFLYLNGTRVIVSDTAGFAYVDDSFNVGAPGGDTGDVDGIWSQLPNTPESFLLPPDSFIGEVNTSGQTAIDFNVTPTWAATEDASYDLQTGSGALFNFQATFATPGTYQIGFMEHDTVDVTYYTDHLQAPNRLWTDITNVHPGFTTSITVQ